MNNTKWRECLSILASHRVYLQLRLVGEADFPLDYEVAHQALCKIAPQNFVFVSKTIPYKDIAALRIVKHVFPAAVAGVACQASLTELKVELAELKRALMQLGQLPLTEDDESILIMAY
ncbi:hypothetical protein [Shewanella sp.]|uniref:hypothetical protein n=1 Tax=Shewanella sp. TaxID=50422 RepID=UPI003A864BF8